MDIQPGENIKHNSSVQTVVKGTDFKTVPIDVFYQSEIDPTVGILKLETINTNSNIEYLYIMQESGISFYSLLGINEDPIGWMFVLPRGQSLFTKSGIVFLQYDFISKKDEILKRVKNYGVQTKLKGLSPVIKIAHSDFSILASDPPAALIIARNQTSVMTQ